MSIKIITLARRRMWRTEKYVLRGLEDLMFYIYKVSVVQNCSMFDLSIMGLLIQHFFSQATKLDFILVVL